MNFIEQKYIPSSAYFWKQTS